MTARLTRRLEDVLWRLPPLGTGAALLAGVAVVIAVCWSTTFDRDNVPLPNHRFLDLNAERSLPAAFSAALLLFAALTAVAWSRRRRPAGGSTAPLLLGCLFAFFAVDEFAFLHERLEKWLDVDWQVLYLPVGAAGAAVGALTLRALPRPRPPALLLAGAGAWLVSQVFEKLQWDGERLVYAWMLFPEEALEMVGSVFFGVAFLVAADVERHAAALLLSPDRNPRNDEGLSPGGPTATPRT